MVSQSVSSWGNLVRSSYVVYALRSRYDEVPVIPVGSTILPHGNGRSYGDSCLNPGGALLLTRSLDRFIAFDRDAGLITCEAGVLLADILQLTVPAGWFLAVVPRHRDSSWRLRTPRGRMARQELPRQRFVCRRTLAAPHVTDRTRSNATTLIRA